MRRWHRPYRRGWFVYYGAAIGAMGLAILGAALAATVSDGRWGFLVVVLGFGPAWLAIIGRTLSFGIYIGQRGIRYRGIRKSVVIGWDDVRGVRLGPLKLDWAPFPAALARTIIIDRHDGAPLQTWVTDKGADFLGRKRAFDRAFASLRDEVERHKADP